MPVIIVESGGRRSEIPLRTGGKGVLSDLLGSAGIALNTRCGKRGVCRGCVVELEKGTLGSGATQVSAPAEIRSCQFTGADVTGDIEIRVPRHARLETEPQVSDSFATQVPVVLAPVWTVVSGTRDTAVAIDVGTTTVAVAVVDLTTGEVLGRSGDFNAQIRFGDNVLTRIVAASSPGAREQLKQAVFCETLVPLITKVCALAGRALDRVAGCMVAGNTTMLHLLAGEDPAGLGVVPFTPRFLESRVYTAGELQRNPVRSKEDPALPADLPFTLLPGFAAYIGADLAAGVYATGMLCDETPSLLVDIGTNGEIVLQAGGRLFGCATAAGPAFEGAGLLAGTRAQAGAISHLSVDRHSFDIQLERIEGGGTAPAPGLCGTAYVDFLASARAAGLLLPAGRFDPAVWQRLPAGRRADPLGGRTLIIADDLRISEADIAQLLQAKAAIGAGIETLLQVAGLRAADLGRVYLAGGFGLFINVEHAIAIGLLPGFRADQICVVGNSSLGGALLAALDRDVLPGLEELRSRMQIIELNRHPGFEDAYLDHLGLP